MKPWTRNDVQWFSVVVVLVMLYTIALIWAVLLERGVEREAIEPTEIFLLYLGIGS